MILAQNTYMKYTGTFTSDAYSSFFGLFNSVYGDIILDKDRNRVSVTMKYKGSYRNGQSLEYTGYKVMGTDNTYLASLSDNQKITVVVDSDTDDKITGTYQSGTPYDKGRLNLEKF